MGRAGYGANDRKLWRCDTCGLVQPWSDSWLWFGSYFDVESRGEENGIHTFCSQKCASASGLQGPNLDDFGERVVRRRVKKQKDTRGMDGDGI